MFTAPGRWPAANSSAGRTSRTVTSPLLARSSSSFAGTGSSSSLGALVHVDAAQSAGKIEVDVTALGADLLTLAGHKLYAPKGVGALFIRRGVRLEPLVHGAGQESGRRAGTENVPYIVALGEACRIARKRFPKPARTCSACAIGSGRTWRRGSATAWCSTAIPSAGCRTR
jgi:hypothetical protein